MNCMKWFSGCIVKWKKQTYTQQIKNLVGRGRDISTVEYQLINANGMAEWKNHWFATIMIKTGLRKTHQWMLNLEGHFSEE